MVPRRDATLRPLIPCVTPVPSKSPTAVVAAQRCFPAEYGFCLPHARLRDSIGSFPPPTFGTAFNVQRPL